MKKPAAPVVLTGAAGSVSIRFGKAIRTWRRDPLTALSGGRGG
jgi:hypothetical protein